MQTVGNYVDIPAPNLDDMPWAHYADVLRLNLLANHGGTWFDATCLQVAPMPAATLNSDFACFSRGDSRMLASWFLHADAGHPLIVGWLDALAGNDDVVLGAEAKAARGSLGDRVHLGPRGVRPDVSSAFA